MTETAPEPLGEYADENGNTFQLNAADAERLGYKRVEGSDAENKSVTPKRAATK